MGVIYGFLGAVLCGALVAAGFALGWKVKAWDVERTSRVTAEQLTAGERERLKQEQAAFRSLQNYNMETAYGMKDVTEDLGRKE